MQDEDNPLRGENFLELVSKNLQEDIQREFYGRILLQHKIFSTHFTVPFLNAISLLFKERVLGPGEMFFEQGSVGQNDIYFIQKGKVEIFYVNGSSTKDLIVNKQGEYFGQREFFSSLPRSSSAKSMTNSHVLVLSQAKFISLLKDYPQDFEMFHKLKDDLLLYNISENNKACTSCGKFNHTLIDCHYLHYKKNHDLLIARYSYSVPSQREKSFIRGFQKTQNALKEKKEVNRNLRKYRIDIFEELLVQEFMAIDEDERQEKLQPNVRRKSLMEVSDRKFFMMLKKMKYEDEKFVLCSDEDDLENSLGNITEISQSEDDRQNEYADENEFNEGEDDGEGEEEDQEENSEFTEGGDIQEREEEEEDDTSGKHTSKVRKQSKKDLTVVQELTSVRKGSYSLGNNTETHGGAGTGQGEISTIMEVDESKKGSQTGNIFQDKLLEYIETLPKVEETKNHKEEGDQEEDNDDKSEKLSKSQLPPSSDSSQTSSSSSLRSLPPPEEQGQDNNQYVPSERNSIEQKEIDSQERTKKDNNKENTQFSSSASSSSQSDSSSDSDTEQEDSSKNYQTKTVLQEQSHKKIKSSKSKSTNNNHHKHHEPQLQKKKHTHNTQPASQLNNNNNNTNNSNTASFISVPQDFSQSNSNSKGADSGGVSQNNGTSSQSQKSISLRNNTNKNSSRSNSSNKKHHSHHPHKLNSNILNSFNKEQDNMNVVQGEKIQIQPSEEIQIPEDEVDSNILFNNLIEIAEVEGEQQQQQQQQINPVSQVITSSKILPAVQEEDYQQKRSEKSKGFQRQHSKVLTFHRSSKIAPPSSSRLEDVENGASFFRGIASEEEGSNNLKKPSSALTATFIPQSPVSREEYSSLQQEFSSLQQEFSAFQQSQQILAQQQQRQSQSMGVSLNHNYSKSSRKYSSSPMSEPSLFSERLKKKSFLTRDQSFKSKLSRESKLLRACDLDDLAPFKNKTPLQKMNSGRGSRFSNAFAEWNATPILKNINGIRDSSDIESSLSLGMFSPMRSFNLKKGQNLGHSFSRNSYQMTSDDEQQHINGLNSMILNNQNQSILQNNGNIKKSKFSNVTRRRSISEDIKLVQGIQGHNQKQSQQGTKNGSLQIQQNLSAGNIVIDPQQKQQQLQQLQQPFGVLPNIERIKQEQERMRRNSPLLVTRNNIISGRRLSVLSTNYNQFRNSLVSSNSNTSGIQNSTLLGGGSIAGSLINGVTPNNKNSTLGNLPANNLPQNELNEEHLVRRLKELLQRQEDDKTPVEGLYSQRGSRMYGVGQDYLMNPLLLDYNMFFMPDFDVMKEYEFYYKNNNYSQVIRKIKGKQKNKRLLYQRVQKKKLLTVYKAHSSTKIDS